MLNKKVERLNRLSNDSLGRPHLHSPSLACRVFLIKTPNSSNLAAFRGFTKLPHPKSRTVRKIADQPANPDRPGVRGVRDRPTDFGLTLGGGQKKQRLPNKESSARGAMPTRISPGSLRRVGSALPRASSWPYPMVTLLRGNSSVPLRREFQTTMRPGAATAGLG